MCDKAHRHAKRKRGVAIGMALASFSVMPAVSLAGGLQIPDLTSQFQAGSAQAQTQAVSGFSNDKAGLGLDKVYNEFQQYKTNAVPGPFLLQRTMAQITFDNRVVIDAVATGDPQALKAQMEGLGATVGGIAGKLVSAQIPIDQIPALTALAELQFARPAMAITHAGSVTSQGDHAMGSDSARTTYSVTGAGNTVGVLSDSYNCLGGAAAGVGSGDLPAGVVVLAEETGCGSGSDEGRAMAEIVHDVAPGAAIQFHSAFNGEADFAQGIIDLKNAGSRIIVDDVGYFDEPFFQDGVIAQAVDTVVAGGAAYFSSAGNSARQSYDSTFRPGTVYAAGAFGASFKGGTAHDFDSGAGVDSFQKVTCSSSGAQIVLSLQWDNPYPSLGGPAPTADVDLYFFNDPPTTLLGASTDDQPPNDPVEILGGGCTGAVLNVMIVKRSGVNPGRVKYINYGYGVTVNEYDTQSPTSVGHPNAAGAIATGAAAYFLTPAYGTTPPVLDYYSSAGGVPILFLPNGTPIPGGTTRAKPELTAPDGGNNTFFGGDYEPDGRPNFFGTSAAAPHAAGVAALMRQVNNTLTPAQIKTAMQNTAIDMLQKGIGSFGGPRVNIGAGFDNDSGSGLLSAPAALAAVVPCHLNAAPSPVNFGNVAVGGNATLNVALSNSGAMPCTVSGMARLGSTDFSIGGAAPLPPFDVNAGSPVNVPVVYTPSGAGADTGTLVVSSNDPVNPVLNVGLNGNGVIVGGLCDADLDGDVDKADLSVISRARGQVALPGDPRDGNGDGKIDTTDVQACMKLCTKANCAI